MKTLGINKKRVVAFLLSLLLIMQQSLTYQVLASTITDGAGNPIQSNTGSTTNGTWNIRPDAVNGQTGFKQFDQINLSQGDVLNFIYNYLNQYQSGTGNDLTLGNKSGDINTFIALVNQGVNINGIVNALQSLNGPLKSDGNLMFISPGGMVVGASGVLNVGNLSVLAPTQSSYDALTKNLNLPQNHQYYITDWDVSYDADDPEGTSVIVPTKYDYTKNTAVFTDKTLDTSSLAYGNDSGAITIDGKVAARGDVTMQGGQVNVNGLVVAGLGNNHTEALTGDAAATQLFESLVNVDNMGSGNTFVNNNGNITIKSVTGTSVAQGAMVRNYGKGDITINNTGASGVNIAGEVSNPNGNLTVTNSAGELLVGNTGVVKNKGTMTFINNGSGTKLALNGTVNNEGTLIATNETGTNGLLVGGSVTNNGNATFTNKTGTLNVTGNVTNTGDLKMTNSGNGGLLVQGGQITNNTGAAIFENTSGSGKLLVNNTGIINSNGSSLQVFNRASGGMDIQGRVNINNSAADVSFVNYNSDMKIGHASVDNNINSNAKVNILVSDGNLLNNGVDNVLINTTDGADLNIGVVNGSIGTDLGNQDGNYTGIWEAQRDLNKSLNIAVDGIVSAISTGTNSSANIASINKDLKVNQISSEGRTTVLADSSTRGSAAYNIINASKDSSKPNIEGKGISIIASGKIGDTNNALTFRQNGANVQIAYDDPSDGHHVIDYKNNSTNGVDMLAIGDINVKGMDADNGDKLDTNVGALISREGSVNAEFSGNTYIRETTAANQVKLTTRGPAIYIDHLGEAPSYDTYTNDYFGPGSDIHPDKAVITALDLGHNSYPDDAADSTIVIKNGTIRGQGQGRPAHEQDVTLIADNAYAGGYYFNLGKHRGEVADSEPLRFNPSTVIKDDTTNAFKNANDPETPISIRGKAVRPEDVTAIGKEEDERNYYYGGSSQGTDDGYDGVKDEDGDYVDNPTTDEQGDENDDDNLVVPEDDEEVVDTDNDTDTDTDTDTDIDTDTDNDTDTDSDTDVDSDTDMDTDTDNDTDNDTDTDMDTDNDTDTDDDTDTDNDTDTDIDNDTDTDSDTDVDSDTDMDTDTDNDTDNDTDTDMDTDNDTDTDDDTDTDNDTDNDIDNDTDTDSDTDVDSDTDMDTDTDNDTDDDTDTDMDTDTDTDNDNDTDIDTDNDTDNDTDTDIDIDPDPDPIPVPPDLGAQLYKQRVVSDRVDSIDKRQFIRFDAEQNQNLITFESTEDVVAISDISRGGVSLKHNKKLKVGDIVPVHLTYGDLEINANVKIVSASDVKAGGKFIDLDQATANKLLYLSLLEKDQPIAQTIQNISTTTIDE